MLIYKNLTLNVMSLFKEMLSSGESVFKNEDALDPEWVPKLLPYREQQQHHIASCIKPLLQERNGRNVFIYGAPGIGKTAATKWVLRDLEENTEEVLTFYVNCWKKNTSYKVIMELCQQLNYTFVQNKKTEELFEIVKNIVNKKSVVFVFDEIDKMEEFEFLYSILNEVYKKTVIIITNFKDWLNDLEDRVKSRLLPEIIEFKQYNPQETAEILKQRLEFAFTENAWEEEALKAVVAKAAESKDIRVGLHLLRESGLIAEESSSKKILLEHAKKAIDKLIGVQIKSSADLDDETRAILGVVKENSGKKIGELFKLYTTLKGECSYKTFQRRIGVLEKGKFIKTETIMGGKDGTTTVITYQAIKKLTEY